MNYFLNINSQNTEEAGRIKNVFLIIFAVLLVGGAFAYSEYRNKQSKNIYKAPVLAAKASVESAEIDTDSDGMKDWEEILAGSDPKDPKSKVTMSSNSTVSADLTKKTEKLSQTDLISRDFFARYMELRQLGSSADAFSQKEVASKTVGNIVLPTPKSYVLSDITTKDDNSKEAIKQYGNDIANIFNRYGVQSRNEAVIAKEALDAEDYEKLKEIDPIIESYKNIVNGLLSLPIPSAISTLHLELVNSMNTQVFIAKALRNSEVDSLASVSAINLYISAQKKLMDSFLAIKSYFSYLGVVFNTGEAGYLFQQK